MAGPGDVLLTIGAATAINTVYDLQHGKSAPVTMLAGGATAALLIIVGSATKSWEVVEALGVAFLVGSLFLHGTDIAGINTLLGSKNTSDPLSQVSPSREQQQHTTAYNA